MKKNFVQLKKKRREDRDYRLYKFTLMSQQIIFKNIYLIRKKKNTKIEFKKVKPNVLKWKKEKEKKKSM